MYSNKMPFVMYLSGGALGEYILLKEFAKRTGLNIRIQTLNEENYGYQNEGDVPYLVYFAGKKPKKSQVKQLLLAERELEAL